MATQDFKRKLTAILSADVKGYSLLMRDDEEATVRTLTTYREVISSVVQKHRGHVVDSPGDNILSEFSSVVDAVRGAVEIQEALKVRNAELPENRRMLFRIGINLGDVIHEEKLARKTLAKDYADAWAYSLLCGVYMVRRQHDKAVVYGEKARALAPNAADIMAISAMPILYSGRYEEAIELLKKAMRHSPYYPSWYLGVLGLGYRLAGQYEEAIATLENWRSRSNPRSALPHLFLAMTYVEAGMGEKSKVEVAEVLKRNPKASIKRYVKGREFPYKDPSEIERVKDSLRRAGMPE